MTTESPFFLAKVECPICKTINEFETVKVGAYVEEGRDTDFCPTNIKWRFPKYEGYNPLLYFIATCSNCFYSREFNNSYKEWKRDNNFRTYRLKQIKDKHLDQLSTSDSIVKKLASALNISRYPAESAIIKLLLGIFDENLSEHKSDLDLGRFYLRIGWVFREMGTEENPAIARIRGLMTEMGQKYESLVSKVEGSVKGVGEFESYLNNHFSVDDVSAEIKSQMYPHQEKFNELIAELKTATDQLRSRVSAIGDETVEYRTAAMGRDVEADGNAFGGYPSFESFLLELKGQWDGVISSEFEALQKAVHHYSEAFSEGREIAKGNQEIQATYLIAELSRRTGDYATARDFFNSTIKNGQDFVYRNRTDKSKTALARKILELAIEQGRTTKEEAATA